MVVLLKPLVNSNSFQNFRIFITIIRSFSVFKSGFFVTCSAQEARQSNYFFKRRHILQQTGDYRLRHNALKSK